MINETPRRMCWRPRCKAAFAVVALVFLVSTVQADEAGIVDVWWTAERDGRVEIAACGDQLCGSIVWLRDPLNEQGQPEIDDENPDPALRTRPIQGLKMLEGFPMQPDAKGFYRGGTIYDPNNGKTYSSHLSLDGSDKLKIRGYVGISLLGRTTVWRRAKGEVATGAEK